MNMKTYKTVDEYIKSFPKGVGATLKTLRALFKKLAPKGEEAMKYGMPTLRLNNKNVLHYAAYEKHIGFYPTPSGVKAFEKDLGKYKFSKGAIQFPIDKPLPMGLITKIAKFRIKEVPVKKAIQKTLKK